MSVSGAIGRDQAWTNWVRAVEPAVAAFSLHLAPAPVAMTYPTASSGRGQRSSVLVRSYFACLRRRAGPDDRAAALGQASNRCKETLVFGDCRIVKIGVFDLRRRGVVALQTERQREVVPDARCRVLLEGQLRQFGDRLVVIAAQRERQPEIVAGGAVIRLQCQRGAIGFLRFLRAPQQVERNPGTI
jgi:hypothetical protein